MILVLAQELKMVLALVRDLKMVLALVLQLVLADWVLEFDLCMQYQH